MLNRLQSKQQLVSLNLADDGLYPLHTQSHGVLTAGHHFCLVYSLFFSFSFYLVDQCVN